MVCSKCNAVEQKGIFCSDCGYRLGSDQITLSQHYEKWKKYYFRRIGKDTQANYTAAWRHLAPLYDSYVTSLRTHDYQQVLDFVAEFRGTSTLKKIKQLARHLCDYAMMEDLIKINYAKHTYIEPQAKKPKIIFTDADILLIYQYAKNKCNPYWETARIVLVLIFTGYRPSELFGITKERVNMRSDYMIGGSKTEAGRNRLVPIATVIRPFVAEWYISRKPSTEDVPSYLILSPKGKQMRLEHWRDRYFYPLMIELGFNEINVPPLYNPYRCRHTFASMCYRADVKPELLIKMMGHTDMEFTSEVYVHNNVQEYHDEISKVESMLSHTNDVKEKMP